MTIWSLLKQLVDSEIKINFPELKQLRFRADSVFPQRHQYDFMNVTYTRNGISFQNFPSADRLEFSFNVDPAMTLPIRRAIPICVKVEIIMTDYDYEKNEYFTNERKL